jgi:hypothetical protein
MPIICDDRLSLKLDREDCVREIYQFNAVWCFNWHWKNKIRKVESGVVLKDSKTTKTD